MASANPTEDDLSSDSDDHDSTFGDDESVLTASLTPSVFNFRFEHDRRYHAYSESKYPVPNDEIESDRLDFQHRAFLLTLDGKLYRAPIRHYIQHVLDVGTGTGIWAMEFCDLHPSAQVIGTDLSPIQPREVPVNCEFLIDDCEEEWLFRKHFELIHARAMVVSIKNWPRFFNQAYAHLVPGGYLELQDITFPAMCTDTSLTPEVSPLLRWSSLFVEAAAKLGFDVTAPRSFGQKLHDTGFVDIRLKVYSWPLGQWAKGEKWKTLGDYAESDLMDWLGGGSLWLFIKMLGWSRIQLELFLAEVRRELRDRKERRFYAHVYFWYARKPAIGESWNPVATPFIQEESIELEVDEETDAGSSASSATPSSALTLRSPSTTLVIPTTELSLASPQVASRSSTPKQGEAPRPYMHISTEDDDSSETSTIQTPRDEGATATTFQRPSEDCVDMRKGPRSNDVQKSKEQDTDARVSIVK